MRKCFFGLLLLLSNLASVGAGETPAKPLIEGVKGLQAVAVGPNGKLYFTVTGAQGGQGQGQVLVLDKGKALPFARGLDQPRGLAGFQGWVFVADKQRVWRIDARGQVKEFAGAAAFPNPPHQLTDITVDPESGLV